MTGFSSGFSSSAARGIVVPVAKRGRLRGDAVTSEFGGELDFSSVGVLKSVEGAFDVMDIFVNGVMLEMGTDYTVSSVRTLVFHPEFRVCAEDKIAVMLKDVELSS